jgi:hypothetical protein
MRKSGALLVIGAFFLSPMLLFARKSKNSDRSVESTSLEPGTFTPLTKKPVEEKISPELAQQYQAELPFSTLPEGIEPAPQISEKNSLDQEGVAPMAPKKSIFDEPAQPKKPEIQEQEKQLQARQKADLEMFLEKKENQPVMERNPSVMVPQEEKVEVTAPALDLTATSRANAQSELQQPQKQSPLLISNAWKEMMRQDLADKTFYINTIVTQGEDDDREKQDFEQRFQANTRWCDNTITKTETVADPYFEALMQRRDRLDTLVRAQRQADTLIQKMSMTKEMTPELAKKLRLAALYALNDLISSSGRLPNEKQIAVIVESKALAYGELKDKDYSDPIPVNILNAELTMEIQRLKNVIAEQSQTHQKNYSELKKDLEDKTQAQIEAHADFERSTAELQEARRAAKEALLRGDIEEQARRQAEFNAKKSIEKSTRRSLELEVSLGQAEKDKIAAERAMYKASADYKEVSELVNDLKKQANELNTRNTDLALNLERVQREKTNLELEREHAQRQYDRLALQQRELSKQLSERTLRLTNLEIMLDHAQHEKSFALNQVSILEKIRKSHMDTEKTLRSYIGQLNTQLETAQQRTTELETVAQKLRDEQFSAQMQIKELERLRAESVDHETILKQAIEGLTHDRNVQESCRQELKGLLDELSNNNSRRTQRQAMQIRQQVETIQNEQDKTDSNITMLRDMQSSQQMQQKSIDSALGGLRTQISSQERQLAELQQAMAQQRIKQVVKGVEERVGAAQEAAEPLSEKEAKIEDLKRKNRELKSRLAALEASVAEKKKQGKAPQPMQKPAPKPMIKPAMVQPAPIKAPAPVMPPAQPKPAPIAPPPAPVEVEEPLEPEPEPEMPDIQEPEEPVIPEEEQDFTEPAGSQPIQQKPVYEKPQQARSTPAEVRERFHEELQQNPEEFRNFVENFQPSQEQIEQAQHEIAAMSPEERKEFENFMKEMMSSAAQSMKK